MPSGLIPTRWHEATLAAALFAIDPVGTGGVVLRAAAGPVRDQWLALLRDLLPAALPIRRIPLHVGDARLVGGLDLAATLAAGRPVAQAGLLAQADGGVVLLSMAERIEPGVAARITAVLDTREVVLERDGLASRTCCRIGVVALDEGIGPDEQVADGLRDRLALSVDLTEIALQEAIGDAADASTVAAAREVLGNTSVDDPLIEALCAAAVALGIDSLRPALAAVAMTRAAAALAGRTMATQADAEVAARLVLAPRATRLPPDEAHEPAPAQADNNEQPNESASREPPEASAGEDQPGTEEDCIGGDAPLEDVVIAAASAALPSGLLARLLQAGGARMRAPTAGRAGVVQASRRQGRPIGTKRGEPRAGARLNVLATLRAAAPWQRLRGPAVTGHIRVERGDFHVTRYRQRTETTSIFLVDASGSAALQRLSEAKGAVELLLAECYVRRDQVALLAFRGKGAEILLAPTRSLVRAKRGLASLPAGGGTPLANGLEAAGAMADLVQRRGQTPIVIVLTDGRANIDRLGQPGRERAVADARAAARAMRGAGYRSLLIDTAAQPQANAQALALEMGADYLALPYGDATNISEAIRASIGT